MLLQVSLFIVLTLIGGACLLFFWYQFQIGSRRKQELTFRLKRAIVGLPVYLLAAWILLTQGLPQLEAIGAGFFIGLGVAFLAVKAPVRSRRIPKGVRARVIERDLTSKGLVWDPAKYHIDHVVPYSRGGDHSVRNLRVVEKSNNLRKGNAMPELREFIKRPAKRTQ